MEKEEKRKFLDTAFSAKYLFYLLFLLLIVLSYFILKPYFIALISSFILSYLVLPLHKKISKITGKSSAALLCVLLVLLIIIIPMLLFGTLLAKEVYQYLSSGGKEQIVDWISSLPFFENVKEGLKDAGGNSISALLSLLSISVSYVASLILGIFIVLFGMYYMLKEWDFLTTSLKKYLPFIDKEKASSEIAKITDGIVYGTLLIAIIEFLAALLGFYIFGAKFALLLAALVFLSAFIPGIGPGAIWIPLAIYYYLIGNHYTFAGVLITGLIISIAIDNLLRLKILGSRSRINPFVMLLGIFGGVSVFGIFGFIIGPLILAYTIELLQEVFTNLPVKTS